jgi:tetratricopeptide (TPR) repeat protein
MRTQITPRTVRRLLAADGYMDLNMPERAIQELNKIVDAGTLEGPWHLMMGLALKLTGELEAAIPHFEKAARVMPSPVRRFAWSELVECYRFVESHDLAELAETLGGERMFELRIGLPFGQLCLESTESISEECV